MTGPTLSETLGAYRTGVEAELQLLEQLRNLFRDQASTSDEPALSRVLAQTEARDRLMNKISALEETVRPMRQRLAAHKAAAIELPLFENTVALHLRARHLIAEIEERGQRTLSALEAADRRRRLAGEMVDKGKTTLSAYRRVVSPTRIPASLITREG